MTTSKNYILRFTLLFAIFLIAACASQPDISVEVLPHYDTLFDKRTGWTRADGAYSVALADDEILWLFGDTGYREVREGRHVDAVIISNSIAIQRGRMPSGASVEFFSGRTPAGKPLAFVRPADGRGWFWIYDGIRVGKGLYLFLVHLERTTEPKSFGFEIIGSQLGHVANPEESPGTWRMTRYRIRG